ncbi:hypothetical protein AVEN_166886-1 [Araneus ventricosus]|uniref:Neurotransmitter-gated ion-channel transmembrane domain-containing protein n=1 Tax=Araneus ventricosus TaxID=182803 RepID=A0A4Y2H649_ARAVE|nr:hypothetical protein AVEN_166886-1 [Araneus ventricosus]
MHVNLWSPKCKRYDSSYDCDFITENESSAKHPHSFLYLEVQSHRSQLPKLNYIIALDIWLFVCIFMVFANLVEFAISYNCYVIRRANSTRSRRQITSAQEKENGAWIANIEEDDTTSQRTSRRFKFRQCRRWFCSPAGRNVTKIDRACRILFPLSFTVFAVAYWGHYLTIYRKEL